MEIPGRRGTGRLGMYLARPPPGPSCTKVVSDMGPFAVSVIVETKSMDRRCVSVHNKPRWFTETGEPTPGIEPATTTWSAGHLVKSALTDRKKD